MHDLQLTPDCVFLSAAGCSDQHHLSPLLVFRWLPAAVVWRHFAVAAVWFSHPTSAVAVLSRSSTRSEGWRRVSRYLTNT